MKDFCLPFNFYKSWIEKKNEYLEQNRMAWTWGRA